jgi:hypothetical protein
MNEESKVRTTQVLLLYENAFQPELVLKINPNDGLDLGLIERENSASVVVQEATADNRSVPVTYENCLIYIDNDCKSGTAQISTKFWKKIGKIGKAALAMRETTLYIVPK